MQLLLRSGLTAVSAILLAGSAWAQESETGFLDRSVMVDDAEYRYQVYAPRDYQRLDALPVVLSLHGGGARGTDGLRQTVGGIGAAIRRNVDRFPTLAVFPQSPVQGPGWQELGGRIALAALNQVIAEFNANESRVYVVGASQGGNGVWYLAYHHPERFAAAVVIAGWIMERRGTMSGALYPAIVPDGPQNPFSVVARRVSGIPLWIFHGDADSVVPVEQSRGMAAALEALGADVRYTEFPGVGHGSAGPAWADENLSVWLFAQERR